MGAKYSTQQIKMKSKKILLLFVFALFMVTLTGCAGADGLTGPAGPAGPAGVPGPAGDDGAAGLDGAAGVAGVNGLDGANGVNGLDGADGLDGAIGLDGASAFDVYMLAYPGYAGTESEWIMDLSTDGLVLTVTVVYNNGVEVELAALNGAMLGVSPYEVNWFLDAGFANLADAEYVTEDMMVYINLASDDIPEPVLGDIYMIDEHYEDFDVIIVNGNPEEVNFEYELLSGEEIFTLNDSVILYAPDGTLVAFGEEYVFNSINNGDYMTDIVIVDDEVIELRFASNDAMHFISNNEDVVVNTHFTDGYVTDLELVYGVTVLDLVTALESDLDGRTQSYTVLDADGDAVTAGSTVVTYDFGLYVLAENQVAEMTFTISFIDNPDDTEIHVDEDYDDIFLAGENEGELWVRPMTSEAEFFAAWVGVADYPVALEVTNSEFEAKKEAMLFDGDKFTVTAIDGTEDLYIIMIMASDDKIIDFDGTEVTTSIIAVAYDFAAADVLGLVTSANGEVQTHELMVWDADLETPAYVDYVADAELVRDGDYKLVVTAEDDSQDEYTFSLNDSESTDVEIIAGAEFEVTELDNEDLTTNVRFDLDASDLIGDVQAIDESTVGIEVLAAAGGDRTGRIYTGDQLLITAEDGTEAVYLITVDEISDETDLFLIDELMVIDELDGDELVVFPQYIFEGDYEDTEYGNIIDELNFEDYVQAHELIWDNAGELESWTSSDGLENLIIRVYAQDYVCVAIDEELDCDDYDDYNNDEGNFEDYAVVVNDLDDNADVELIETDAEMIIDDLGSDTIEAFMHWVDGTLVDEEDILAELDLLVNFQDYDEDGDLAGEDYVITVIAQDGVTETEYAVELIISDETDITLVDEPVVVDEVDGAEIIVLPQFVDGSSYEDVSDTEILADLDLEADHQSAEAVTWDDVDEEYDSWDGEYEDMFIAVTAEDDETVDYYEVVILDPSDETELVASGVEGAIEWTLDGTTLTVENGSNVDDLYEALDLEANFQTAQIVENDMESEVSGDLSDYNYLVVTAQNEEVETYLIMVAAAVEAPYVEETSTDFAIDFTVEAEDEVSDLLDALADVTEYDLVTFEVLTSEELGKEVAELFEYDLLVATYEDGTQNTYTILFD